MKPATRLALVIVTVLLALAAAAAASVTASQHDISQSQQRWCDTLRLLTSRPVTPPADPGANQARAGQYRLYEDFRKLRREFGCG